MSSIRTSRLFKSSLRISNTALLVAVLGIGATSVGIGPVGLIGTAHAQSSEKVRPEIAKPLQAAQDAIRAQKYKDALNRIHEADAVGGKTPFETYMIDRTRGAAAMGAGDNETAGRSFEAALNSGRVAPAEQGKIIQALASLYYRAGDYPKAIQWLQRSSKDGVGDGEDRALLIQA
jgi:tetratricopeptide (TPR) repeat protein